MNTLLRIICRLLVTTLGTLFGLGAGVLAVYYGFCAAFGELGRDDWGAAPIWLMAMAIGGLVGALIGAVASFNWTLGEDFRAFNLFEWLGVVLGCLGGVAVFQFLSERYYLWFRGIFMAALLPICVLIACLAMRGLAMALQAKQR